MIKFMGLLYKKPGISDEEFRKHWKEIHAPLVVKLPFGLVKYKQNHLLRLPGVKYEDDGLLGIVEAWHDSLESHEKFAAWRKTKEAEQFLKDEDLFSDRSRLAIYRVEEHTIL